MKINAETAVSHVTISLENTDQNYWTDEDGNEWSVRGRNDTIVIEIETEDGTTFNNFRLVPVD